MPIWNINRRQLLQRTAFGLLASWITDSVPGLAKTANRLNFMCWEGYDDVAMYDSFIRDNDVAIEFELIADSPGGFARLLANNDNATDVVATDSPWVQRMGPADLCVFLDPADFADVMANLYPQFSHPFEPLLYDGKITGLPTRWAWVGPAINLDETSEREWRSYDPVFDPANRNRIGIMDWGDWPIMPMALHAGINPYEALDDYALAELRKVLRAMFKNTTVLFSDMSVSQKALLDGSVKALVGTGNYHTAALRRAGYKNVLSIVPEPVNGFKKGIIAVEGAALVRRSEHPDLAKRFLKYLMSTETLYRLSWTNFAVAPVANRIVESFYSAEQKDALQFDYYEEAWSKSVIHDIAPDIEAMLTIWQEELAAAL